ncbi:hypothetical protein [uncultured Tateyamaria sp.]|uniref:hypothetical protein n=1 Tax=uncultured Tateyamaria sp. TaxID=455651 RepID=UPI002608E561|nr:hypothetical protein [uncultured Tateyamaria sp.]
MAAFAAVDKRTGEWKPISDDIGHTSAPIENVMELLCFLASLGFLMCSIGNDRLPAHALILGDVCLRFHHTRFQKDAGFSRGFDAFPIRGDVRFVLSGAIEEATECVSSKGIQIEFDLAKSRLRSV